MLPIELQSSVHIDLSKTNQGSNSSKNIWRRWNRLMMGFKTYPYEATQGLSIAEEFIRGNNEEWENPLCWDFVKLNLPGNKNYNNDTPRVTK